MSNPAHCTPNRFFFKTLDASEKISICKVALDTFFKWSSMRKNFHLFKRLHPQTTKLKPGYADISVRTIKLAPGDVCPIQEEGASPERVNHVIMIISDCFLIKFLIFTM
jgi:hypothetical protein